MAGYGMAIKQARMELGLSLRALHQRLLAAGHKLSLKRLEQLEYQDRALNAPGRQRLAQIAEALQATAAEQGKDPRPYAEYLLFPTLFEKPAEAATAVPVTTQLSGRPSGTSKASASSSGADGKPALINAAILFVDLMNSVALSTALSLWDYNDLINEYQAVLREILENVGERYPIGEYYLGGDQLAVFFYDHGDAGLHERAVSLRRRNPDSARAAEIDAQLARNRNRALYGALRCAVSVKNAWMAHPRNVARVETDQPVLDVGIGINTGNVVLQRRGDGSPRIEGFAINFAKRVEGFSRHGHYCRVMLSKAAYEMFRSIVIEDAMLKQRAFFASYTPVEGQLKGLSPGMELFELKFFHRLAGFTIPPEQIPLYRQIFENDPTNIWAYANLMNYHLFSQGSLDTAQDIAERALYSNPGNEKIYYDLAFINFERGDLELARQYALQCIKLNDQMDIAYDLLSDIEIQREAWERVLEHISRALALSPGSAGYHQSYAMALARLERRSEAREHYAMARKLFPGFDAKYPEHAAAFAALQG